MLYGPLHNEAAVKNYEQAISAAKAQGGTIVYGGKVHMHVKKYVTVYTFSRLGTRLGTSEALPFA